MRRGRKEGLMEWWMWVRDRVKCKWLCWHCDGNMYSVELGGGVTLDVCCYREL